MQSRSEAYRYCIVTDKDVFGIEDVVIQHPRHGVPSPTSLGVLHISFPSRREEGSNDLQSACEDLARSLVLHEVGGWYTALDKTQREVVLDNMTSQL